MATSRYRSTRGQEVYLSDAQLAWKLNQTLTYSMLPIDIRVWDAFLFSTFTDANGAPTLVRIYIGLIMQGHTATDILKWCKEGTLVNHAVEILTPWVATQNGELVRKDLLFLVENSAALTDWNQRLSSFDGSTARGRWTTQAMWCVMAGKPPGRDANADIEWLKRRNALFAWGVAIWRIPPDPIWVVYDPNLDVYHDLGYVVATTPAWAGSLRNEYHARFGYDKMGIPRADNFEEFYGIWQTQSFLRYFNPNWGDRKFRKNLEDFFNSTQGRGRVESVWRLHHLVQLGDTDFIEKGPTGIFAFAWHEYGLAHGTPTQILKRKVLFHKTLEYCGDPMQLHIAMRNGQMRDFVERVYFENQMPVDVNELGLI